MLSVVQQIQSAENSHERKNPNDVLFDSPIGSFIGVGVLIEDVVGSFVDRQSQAVIGGLCKLTDHAAGHTSPNR